MKRRRQPRHAFTLLEVMIAGSILLVGAAALLSAWFATARIVSHQRHVVESLAVTRKYAERLLLLSDSHLMDTPSRQVDGYGVASAGGLYTVTWTCDENKPFLGATTCEVKTSWDEAGQTKSTNITVARDTR
jgi:prepilin-type N-terminal cleavage/methylation domain-containing protein